MNFPTMVYKTPGKFKAPGGKGRTYDFAGVDNQEQLNVFLSKGWSLTISCDQENRENVINNSAPTRKELEQKAEELKLKFDGRTSDAKLLEKINESLRA